jgi:hypothetical protein
MKRLIGIIVACIIACFIFRQRFGQAIRFISLALFPDKSLVEIEVIVYDPVD